MHEEINSPTPPQREGPELTTPSMACLTDEERNELGNRVGNVMDAIRNGPEVVFDLAMDNFVAMGPHMVGHGLQAMVWSAFQALMLISGQPPHDARNTFVSVEVSRPDGGTLTEADNQLGDMVKTFVQATLGGAHAAAIDAWADWCNGLAEHEWDQYCRGIAMLVEQAITISTSKLEEGGDMADAVLGGPSTRLVPRHQED